MASIGDESYGITKESNYKEIAAAIKEKNGKKNEIIKPGEMAQAIRDIPTGGSIDSVSVGVCVTESIKDYVTVGEPETYQLL